MKMLLILLVPAICLIFIFLFALFIEFYIRMCKWISAISSLSFDAQLPPNPYQLNNKYGLEGSINDFGNIKIKKLTKNYLSFDVTRSNNHDLDCFIVSNDVRNDPHRHLVMRIKREKGLYPISIETIGKNYFSILNESSLKIAIGEIFDSCEFISLTESILNVFWSRYDQTSELDISSLGENDVKEYHRLMKLRKLNTLKNEKDRLKLIEIYQKCSPPVGEKIQKNESDDLEKLCLVKMK